MLKVGILGAGQAAAAHADGVTRSGLGQVMKIYAPGGGAGIAPRYGARPAASAEEIFSDTAIDAVVIASPTDTHLEYLRAAVARGKHVLCEVPVARTEQELDAADALLKDLNGKVAAGALLARYDAPITHLRTLATGGELGTIGTIRLGHLRAFREGANSWYGEFHRSGGVVLSQLPFLLDAVRFCFGEVARVSALRGAEKTDLSQDYVLVVGRLASGALLHLEASWAESDGPTHTYYEIAGSQGILEFDTRIEPKVTLQPKGGAAPPPAPAAGNLCNPAPSTPYELLAADFLQAIREGRASSTPLSDAVAATRLALGALQGAEEGAVVTATL